MKVGVSELTVDLRGVASEISTRSEEFEQPSMQNLCNLSQGGTCERRAGAPSGRTEPPRQRQEGTGVLDKDPRRDPKP